MHSQVARVAMPSVSGWTKISPPRGWLGPPTSPLRWRLKGPLGTATQARAAVTKSGAKVARLEVQLTNAVEQHDAAMAELAASRAKLAEAEAATARAASVALPPEHYLAAVATDPGPFWSAFKSVIVQRCPGLPSDFIGQLDNVTKAFEAVIEPISLATGSAAAQQPAAGILPQGPPGATTPTPQPAADADAQAAELAPKQPTPAMPPTPTPTSAEEAIALAWNGQLTAPAQAQRLAPHGGVEAGQSSAPHSISISINSRSNSWRPSRQPWQRTQPGRSWQPRRPLPLRPSMTMTWLWLITLLAMVFTVAESLAPALPSLQMTRWAGAAADGVVNKRGIAEVASAARAIVAKARAKQHS